MSNPLVEAIRPGQSIGYEEIRRVMLDWGDLPRKIAEDDPYGIY
ncbi:MAG TPA: hypothetical protein VF708_09090 [Pyrinomonadaceae bacterium]|jgi:hypothetical protein